MSTEPGGHLVGEGPRTRRPRIGGLSAAAPRCPWQSQSRSWRRPTALPVHAFMCRRCRTVNDVNERAFSLLVAPLM